MKPRLAMATLLRRIRRQAAPQRSTLDRGRRLSYAHFGLGDRLIEFAGRHRHRECDLLLTQPAGWCRLVSELVASEARYSLAHPLNTPDVDSRPSGPS